MVTKAELEKQVAELKRQLEEKSEDTEPNRPSPHSAGEALKDVVEDIPEKMSAEFENWSGEIEAALAELDTLPHKKAILFALGVFVAGYVIGRSGRS